MENKTDLKEERAFNISMNPFTIEANDHFDAVTKFFNIQEGLGVIWCQEMKGAEKIGDPLNIRTIFNHQDSEDSQNLKSLLDALDFELEKLAEERIAISNHYDQAVPKYSELNLNKALRLKLHAIRDKVKST